MKKILLVDDSALMRSVLSDIINADSRFHVEDRAADGIEALEILKRKTYDAVVLDVNMPRMDGIQLLRELQKNQIAVKIMMASTDTVEGAKVTLDALELGAIDFIHKPDRANACRSEDFSKEFTDTLAAVCAGQIPKFTKAVSASETQTSQKINRIVERHSYQVTGNRVVAIASSTGGPRALQALIPKLPHNLKAPVVLVQHMPVGFTASLAERLDSLSAIHVKEAAEGDILQAGTVYIARGGVHMYIRYSGGKHIIHLEDGPNREGVKPCANYMYESLEDSGFDEVVCVVLTGMGSDGTEGIKNLKARKRVHVISQDEGSCTVYGMPRAVAQAGLSDQTVRLDDIAQEIIMNVGIR